MNHYSELWLRMEKNHEGLIWAIVEYAPSESQIRDPRTKTDLSRTKRFDKTGPGQKKWENYSSVGLEQKISDQIVPLGPRFRWSVDPWFRFPESNPEFNILTSDYKIRFWKCDTVINNKPISWSQNRCGLSRANRGEILNTWLKLWVTWIHESHFMNVPFIKIEILTGCLIRNCLILNNPVSADPELAVLKMIPLI